MLWVAMEAERFLHHSSLAAYIDIALCRGSFAEAHTRHGYRARHAPVPICPNGGCLKPWAITGELPASAKHSVSAGSLTNPGGRLVTKFLLTSKRALSKPVKFGFASSIGVVALTRRLWAIRLPNGAAGHVSRSEQLPTRGRLMKSSSAASRG